MKTTYYVETRALVANEWWLYGGLLALPATYGATVSIKRPRRKVA